MGVIRVDSDDRGLRSAQCSLSTDVAMDILFKFKVHLNLKKEVKSVLQVYDSSSVLS